MRVFKIIAIVAVVLQVIIFLVFLPQVGHLAGITGSGRAQGELILIAPIILSGVVAILSFLVLLIMVILQIARKSQIREWIYILLIVGVLFPLFTLGIFIRILI